MMFYPKGEKIELLDEVLLDSGLKGHVIGFDIINDRDFVEIRTDAGKVWVSTNALTKI